MRKYIRENLHRVAAYLELFVAFIITIMIAFSIINMVIHIAMNPFEIDNSESFYSFMNDALSLIIGIEFLKMIIIPTSDNIIETLLFAVSRHVILDHELGVMIVGVLCVMVLFFVKKYLFSTFEETEKYIFRAKTKIELVNRIAGLSIPIEYGLERIGQYTKMRLIKMGKAPRLGAKVPIQKNIYLVVNKVNKNSEIKSVELVIDREEHENDNKEETEN